MARNPRVAKTLFWHVTVVAAYMILGHEEKARAVVQQHFSDIGIKRRYMGLFESLGMT